MISLGNAGAPKCSGTYAYDFNAHIASGVDPRLIPGANVNAQFWYRDTNAPAGPHSSNAILFRICPHLIDLDSFYGTRVAHLWSASSPQARSSP